MTPGLLLLSLKAIERVSTKERPNAQNHEKTSHKSNKGYKRPGVEAAIPVLKKTHHKKYYVRSMGVCTPSTIPRFVVDMTKTEQRNPTFRKPRRAPRNPVP
jgi:hypothetical protein